MQLLAPFHFLFFSLFFSWISELTNHGSTWNCTSSLHRLRCSRCSECLPNSNTRQERLPGSSGQLLVPGGVCPMLGAVHRRGDCPNRGPNQDVVSVGFVVINFFTLLKTPGTNVTRQGSIWGQWWPRNRSTCLGIWPRAGSIWPHYLSSLQKVDLNSG